MDNDFEKIKSLEIELTTKATRSNPERLSELLADDFQELGRSGNTYTKLDIIADLPTQKYTSVELHSFQFDRISTDKISVSYKSTDGKSNVLRNSTWVKNCDNWKMSYHRGTLCK